MPVRHKDIRSLEAIPAAAMQKGKIGLDPSLRLLLLENIPKSQKNPPKVESLRSRLSEHVTVGQKSFTSVWLPPIFFFFFILQDNEDEPLITSTSIKWTSSLLPPSVPSPSAATPHRNEFPGVLLTSPPSLRWEKRRDFLSFLSLSVSFITWVVISQSWDFFFPFVGSVKGG